MSMLGAVRATVSSTDAPITLSEPPPRTLNLRETTGLWGNLGVSLLLPVAATYAVLTDRPLSVTIGAIIAGAVVGSVLLGLGAVAGAREGVPAMVLMREVAGRADAVPADCAGSVVAAVLTALLSLPGAVRARRAVAG
jgi:NCS1 family nucleobase:cation symporter-1